jgi:hypothetical protein
MRADAPPSSGAGSFPGPWSAGRRPCGGGRWRGWPVPAAAAAASAAAALKAAAGSAACPHLRPRRLPTPRGGFRRNRLVRPRRVGRHGDRHSWRRPAVRVVHHDAQPVHQIRAQGLGLHVLGGELGNGGVKPTVPGIGRVGRLSVGTNTGIPRRTLPRGALEHRPAPTPDAGARPPAPWPRPGPWPQLAHAGEHDARRPGR